MDLSFFLGLTPGSIYMASTPKVVGEHTQGAGSSPNTSYENRVLCNKHLTAKD